MKHIKTFEHTIKNKIPQIGDYAIADTRSTNQDFKSFINNNIGLITYIENEKYLEDCSLIMKYNNIPDNVRDFFDDLNPYAGSRTVDIELLKHFSKNKEDLIPFISANKFNL